MSILSKVKKLVSADGAAEEKPQKKAALEAKPKRVAAKKAPTKTVAKIAAASEHTHNENDGHDHAGHNHAPQTPAARQSQPQAVSAAVGIGAAHYILRPLITEKGTTTAQHGTYMFAVKPEAGKAAIKQAIEKLYGVTVVKVRTSRYDGKVVRTGKISGRRSNFKKAFVTVADGQQISIHNGV